MSGTTETIKTIEQAKTLIGTTWERDGLQREITRIENLRVSCHGTVFGNVYWRRPGHAEQKRPLWFPYFQKWLCKANRANTFNNISVRRQCPECGGSNLEWGVAIRNTSGVVDGRLRAHDMTCDMFLGCAECSETIMVVDANEVAAYLTEVTYGRK